MSKNQHARLYREDFAILHHLKGSEKDVYQAILFHAKETYKDKNVRVREAYMSQETLAKLINRSQSVITRAIRRLKSLNLLSAKKRFGNSAIYTIITNKDTNSNSSTYDQLVNVDSNSSTSDHSRSSTSDHSKSSTYDHSRSSTSDQQTIYKQNNKQYIEQKTISKSTPIPGVNDISWNVLIGNIQTKLHNIPDLTKQLRDIANLEDNTESKKSRYDLQVQFINANIKKIKDTLDSVELNVFKQSIKNKYFTIVDNTNDSDKDFFTDEFGRVFVLNSKRKAPTEKKKYIPYFLLDDSTPDF